MFTISSFFSEAQPIITAFNTWASTYSPAARADHLCYKCGSLAEYEEIRRMFETESVFIYQSIISKRRISIIVFTKPIQTLLGDIRILELSDQKPDGSQTSGFDHVEIYPEHGTEETLAQQLETGGYPLNKIIRPHHTTFDGNLGKTWKIRLEREPLLEKIKREEMR